MPPLGSRRSLRETLPSRATYVGGASDAAADPMLAWPRWPSGSDCTA